MNAFDVIQRQIDAGAIAGAVALVADAERVLEARALGKADLATGRPMAEDSLFWIASVSKPMTGVLLMMMVDEAKLSLDDLLEKYLPAFADADAKSITIRQAMSHTSGLPFFSRPEKRIDRYPLAEAAMSYAMSPRLFDPGTKYQYGNAGINSVGRIIEIVSGTPFEQLLSKRLLQPLGMRDTTFFPTAQQLTRLATAYTLNEAKTQLLATQSDQLSYPLDAARRYPSPAGGLFSTAGDVARFGQFILNGGVTAGVAAGVAAGAAGGVAGGVVGKHRLLSRQAVATMTSTQTGSLFERNGTGSGYGIGWETTTVASDRAPAGRCGHGGALSNHLDVNPETNRVSVFMVQQQGWMSPEAGEMREQFDRFAGQVTGRVDG